MAAPVVHINRQGNLANQMIQYMVARRIAAEVENCKISNVCLPDWNIDHPVLPSSDEPTIEIYPGEPVDSGKLAQMLASGKVSRVIISSYGQRLSNFPRRDACEDLFPRNEADYPGFGPEFLVCNIRGGEILDARHPDYTLLPCAFYKELARTTDLRMVFQGQIEDNIYCAELRDAFPNAIFRESHGAINDFQTLRNSHNIVPAISTFSWLAAWLSRARSILFPVNGLFHPFQNRDVDLLPLDDPRYIFYLFPINFAASIDRLKDTHAGLEGTWRRMRPEMIGKLCEAYPRWPRDIARFIDHFDETEYLAAHPDVAEAVRSGSMPSGLHHYRNCGFAEGRAAFAFDGKWYGRQYPMAAFEVGQGDYFNFEHHYVEVGALRGYARKEPTF